MPSKSTTFHLVFMNQSLTITSMHFRHYYVVVNMKPNGNMTFAMDETNSSQNGTNRRALMPVAHPLIPPRSAENRNAALTRCGHTNCISGFHGDYCDGSKPGWFFSLSVNLLNPGIIFRQVSSKARSVVLASGSLSPIMALCAELDLISPHRLNPTNTTETVADKSSEDIYRLQIAPKPLEANHIIDMEKQLLAFSIGEFPDGSILTMKQSSYTQRGFLTKLGNALVRIITAVPTGGVLSK